MIKDFGLTFVQVVPVDEDDKVFSRRVRVSVKWQKKRVLTEQTGLLAPILGIRVSLTRAVRRRQFSNCHFFPHLAPRSSGPEWPVGE